MTSPQPDTSDIPPRVSEPVVVCGAGAAGIAAALSAAQSEAEVLLIESRPQIGGTVAHALIHTLAGFHDAQGTLLNEGLPAHLIDRLARADPTSHLRRMGRVQVYQVAPALYARVVSDWIAEQSRIHVVCGAQITRVTTDNDRIVELALTAGNQTERIRPRAVIDATGSGHIVRLTDPQLIDDDGNRAAGGLIFTLRGVEPGTLAFPRGIGIVRRMREAAGTGELPAECQHAWLDIGTREDEVYVKLFVPLRTGGDNPEVSDAVSALADRMQQGVLQLLRTLPEFAHSRIHQVGQIGIREGGRIKGEYRLTRDDVLAGRSFPDGIARCAWPIEFWDPESGLLLEHLPEGSSYDIPLRSLTVRGYRNFLAAGKCLSADRHAQASARVVGSCWAMGEVAGRTAALM